MEWRVQVHDFRVFVQEHARRIILITGAVCATISPFIVSGATVTWDGGGTTNDWSECANWSGDVCPVSGDTVVFDSTSSKDSTVDALFGGTVATLNINAGYTGTTTLGRSLTVSNFTLASGGFALSSNTFTLNGAADFTQTGGTYDAGTGSTVFNGGNGLGDQVINVPTSVTFYNMTVDKGAYALTIASGDTVVVSGTLTYSTGYIETGTIDIDGSLVVESGADGGNGVLLFNDTGDETITCTNGGLASTIMVSKPSGTLDFSCSTFGNGSFATVGGLIITSGTFSIGSATYTTRYLTKTGGTFDGGTGTFVFAAYFTTIDVDSTTTFYNLSVTSGPANVGTGDTLIVSNTFTHTDGTVDGGTIEPDGTAVIGGSADGGTTVLLFNDAGDETISCTNGGIASSVTVSKPSGILDFSCTSFVSGPFTLTSGTFSLGSKTYSTYSNTTISGGTLDEGTGTFVLYGTTGTINVPTTETFYNLTINHSNGWTRTISSGDTLVVTNTFTHSDGAIDTGTIEIDGTATVASTADGGSAILLFNDTGDETITCTSGGVASGISVAKPSGTLDFSCSGLLVAYGGITLSSGILSFGSNTLTTYGNVTISGGTLDEGSSSFVLTGTNTTINVPSTETFYNLTINHSNGWTQTVSSGDTLVVANTFTHTDGALSGGTIEARGDVTVGANADGGTTEYLFSGAATQTFTLGSAGLVNSDIAVNKSGGAVNLASALTMDAASQDLLIVEGTFDISGYNLTVNGSGGTFIVQDGGNMQLQGGETTSLPTLQAGSTVTYDGAGSYSSLRMGASYYNLAFAGSGSFSTSSELTIYEDFTQTAGSFTHSGTTTFPAISTITTAAGTDFTNVRFTSYASQGIYASTTLYWRLDESSGGSTVADSSTAGRTGSHSGTGGANNYPQPNASIKPTLNFDNPYSLHFDGTDDQVTSAYTLSNVITNSAATISLWVYPTGSSPTGANYNSGKAAFSDTGAYIGIYRGTVGGLDRIWVYNWDGTQDVVGITYNADEWTHITLVHSGGTLYAYKNGSFVNSIASGNTASLANQIRLGYSTLSTYWTGYIDDVRVYNVALTDSEIADLAAGEEGSTPASVSLAGSAFDLAGNLMIGDGSTLDASASGCSGASCPISLAGNWINDNGTFTARTGTTTFDGTNQFISGTTTFHNFEKTTASTDTLTFGANQKQTMTGRMVLQGAADNLLSIRSSTDATHAQIDPQGSRTVSYLDVQDSENTNATVIDAVGTGSQNSGNNINWSFALPVVTTEAATFIVATSSRLNADITSTGGSDVTARGFATSTSATLTSSVSTTTESGTFSTGTFSATSTNLSGNTTYYFRAFATTESGTAYGSIASFLTTPAIPGTPAFSSVTATTVHVEWTEPSGGATTYKVERCAGDGCSNFAEIATGVAGTAYDDSGLTHTSVYRYRVRATNATGDSLYSTVADVTTSTDSTPAGSNNKLRSVRLKGGTKLR